MNDFRNTNASWQKYEISNFIVNVSRNYTPLKLVSQLGAFCDLFMIKYSNYARKNQTTNYELL
ncbi:hypothetical protein T08_1782 [Trichinella sp. T8]|nr:hypothetical protein T08_1782 [Trichinella sp. T8]